ncbi:dense granule protein GRA7 [Besnoitia besnoiti]|uniref:Dense granule protein GRA7 n=1 Tax=Besnoitia besnoiti TaxID=94643 RepID=A0A2A9MLZ2_BESBE|nr:dense granule protein GRA7 [Besnoitia besnoiti]PFH36737.1 dense granule protein GRA7 [Besnoitia besnoiti]
MASARIFILTLCLLDLAARCVPGLCQGESAEYQDALDYPHVDADQASQHLAPEEDVDEENDNPGVVEKGGLVRTHSVGSRSTENGGLLSKISKSLYGATGSFAVSAAVLPELTEGQINGVEPVSLYDNVRTVVGLGALAAMLSFLAVSAYKTGKHFLRRRHRKSAAAAGVSILGEEETNGPTRDDH